LFQAAMAEARSQQAASMTEFLWLGPHISNIKCQNKGFHPERLVVFVGFKV